MAKIEIIAVGKLKQGAQADLIQEYLTRIKWPLTIHEVESKITDSKAQQAQEHKLILEKLDNDGFLIILDERGKSPRSMEFAQQIEKLQNDGIEKITFIIGGADGLTDDIRQKANMMISFGHQTWPHMMVRTMLLEQIYRAQQILAGHPYHREG